MAFHCLGQIISILNSKHFLIRTNPLDKPWQQNSGWLFFPQWLLDSSELIFALFVPVCTAFSCITIYFIKTFLTVLIPGYTINFRIFPKSYQQFNFFSISLIKILTNTHMVPIAMSHFQKHSYSVIPHWQQLLGSCQREMVLILYKIHWLLRAHNSQWSQWNPSGNWDP